MPVFLPLINISFTRCSSESSSLLPTRLAFDVLVVVVAPFLGISDSEALFESREARTASEALLPPLLNLCRFELVEAASLLKDSKLSMKDSCVDGWYMYKVTPFLVRGTNSSAPSMIKGSFFSP